MLLKSASQDVCVCNDLDSRLPLLFSALVACVVRLCSVKDLEGCGACGAVWRQGLVRLFIGGFSRCQKERCAAETRAREREGRAYKQLHSHLLRPSPDDQVSSGKSILAPRV